MFLRNVQAVKRTYGFVRPGSWRKTQSGTSSCSLSTSRSLRQSDEDPKHTSGTADGLSSKSSEERRTDSKENNGKSPPRGSRLKTVLAGMKIERFATEKAPFAAPTEKRSANVEARERHKPTVDTAKEEPHPPRLDPALVEATEQLASALSFKIDPQQIKSELLTKLMEHSQHPGTPKASREDLSHLIAGMKIDRTQPKADPGAVHISQLQDESFDRIQAPMRAMLEPLSQDEWKSSQGGFAAAQRRRRQETPHESIDLFGARPLGIFKGPPAQPQPVLKTWEMLEQQALQSLITQPPRNAFEEMITWTKEGKMWTFPIDNEQGWDEEHKTDFSEHVFLDHLIADFPKKGPIRQFMDLVVHGLSKNSYISVKEKEEHVDWFRNYFKEKRSILVDIMGEELGSFTERTLSDEEDQQGSTRESEAHV